MRKTAYYRDKVPQKALPNVEPIKVSEGGSASIDPAKAVTSTRLSVFDTNSKGTNSSEDSNIYSKISPKQDQAYPDAAEEGYDKIAWTNGDMQSERYGLGVVVDNIAAGEWVSVNGKTAIPFNEEYKALNLERMVLPNPATLYIPMWQMPQSV